MSQQGLYIHIPFCKSKCIYCDFYSEPALGMMDKVVDGLINEYRTRFDELDHIPDTIYIGGGTPSVLQQAHLRRLLAELPVSSASEITLEANPDDITPDLIALLRECGVNRLSLGVQSLEDNLLKWMRRRHNADTALQAIATARKGGFNDISADLIYGLPGMSIPQWTDSVKRLIDTGITHLSAYCLTYAEGTQLMRELESGRISEVDDATLAQQFEILRKITSDNDFEHYEISNFARPGFRSKHNSSYWNPDARWLGIGPAAHSFDGRQRQANPSDMRKWLSLNGHAPEAEEETDLDLLNDRVITALRTAEGFDLRGVSQEISDRLLANAAPHLARHQMTHINNRLAINPDCWLISNIFMRDMILE